MRIDRQKLDLTLAKQRKAVTDLRSTLSPATITRIRQGCNVGTRTAGKLAHALGVPIEDLVEQEATA